MQGLFKAIYGKFSNADGVGFMDGDVIWADGDVEWEDDWHEPIYEYLNGRLYLNEVPQGSAYPNAAYNLVSNTNDWTFTNNFDDALIQFNLYSESNSAVEIVEAQRRLCMLYDDCSLASSDLGATWNHIFMIQDGSWLGKIPHPDSTGGGNVWRYVTEYKVKLTTV